MAVWRADERLGALVDTELAAALDEAAAQNRARLVASWLRVLGLVQARGTPLRAVTRFDTGIARLQFADHSAVLVDCSGPHTRVGEIAVAVARQVAVVVTDVRVEGDGVTARLAWGRHAVEVHLLGGDQAR
ncbi:hypothetical protein [Aestuariimicrobium sp. T2.26MG-19.2B]|uniref:hypothetical protein n=1 Tax=Aestuariimicrobium sp. T2.26MG-19.2B TaxID=3040679 RepID=UPI002477B383|nr:hypothetical protein [Aestuariimicrobium sp. T2.26MG-19.2B]CAI9400230.1 hypothetical protein AESSP_00348 [Aestuariimicrobium sp. T2.26MG-19.2B]